jgi:hypothetical protein
MTGNANELWLIDLDRTLLDIDRAFDELVLACAQAGIGEEAMLWQAKHSAERTGGSFDVIGHLARGGMDDDSLDSLYDAFVAGGSGEDLLYADAPAFMLEIQGRDIPHAILTYGARPWQTAKLERAGLISTPHIITGQKHKGELIQSWHDGDGYVVNDDNDNSFEAERIILVDDKAASYRGIPEDCGGYLVRRGEQILMSQQGSVPPQIVTVRGLAEIVPFINRP